MKSNGYHPSLRSYSIAVMLCNAGKILVHEFYQLNLTLPIQAALENSSISLIRTMVNSMQKDKKNFYPNKSEINRRETQ